MEKLTSDQSRMSYQPTLLDSIDVISSPGSESGITHSTSQEWTDKYGRVPAHASLSARQAKEKGLLTSGTYGLRSSISSSSADLTHSLANRYRARTEGLGSTLYTLTWKQRATPSGRLIFRLAASERRTSVSGFSSWPTLDATNRVRDEETMQKCADFRKRNANQNTVPLYLAEVANLASWPTPQAGTPAQNGYNEAGNTDNGRKTVALLRDEAYLAGWMTPAVTNIEPTEGRREKRTEYRKSVGRKDSAGGLAEQVVMTTWVTPAVRDYKGGYHGGRIRDGKLSKDTLDVQAQLTASGDTQNGSTAETESTGQLNPAFSLWLMGLPDVWHSCGVRATQLVRGLRKRSLKHGSK